MPVKLDIRSIESGGRKPFDDSYDLSEMDFFGECPIPEPLRFTGEVVRGAGLTRLEGTLSTRLHLRCDHCGEPFEREKTVSVSLLLVSELQGSEERDDIVVCPGGICDLEQIAVPEWVLAMDYRNLCREDCEEVVCFSCGGERGQCGCKYGSID